MIWIVLAILGLGLMVFIHELGHFVAAKMNGVAVETFSLGWGPRMAGFRRGGTWYQVSWFPIGGYCKFKGELTPGIGGGGSNPVPAPVLDGGPGPAASSLEGSFLAAAPWRRIVIAAFGPLFNVLFALIVFAAIWWVGFATYSSDNRIILASDYSLDTLPGPLPAAVAGLKTGDRITAIDGVPVEKFQDILGTVSTAPGRTLSLTVARNVDGALRTLNLRITPELDRNTGAARIGIYSWVDPVIGAVTSGSPAAIAGLRAGDRIVSVDGKPVANSIDISQDLASKPAKIEVTYERSGARETVPVVFDWEGAAVVTMGIDFAPVVFHSPRLGPLGALRKSAEETWNTVAQTVKGFGLFFQGIKLRNAVAGPLRITYYIGEVARSGFQMGFGAGMVQTFRFLAFLSVVLFLMNLLPIPAMDGGQIVLFTVEIIRRKPVRSTLIWRLQLIGFGLMVGLLLLATYGDILFFRGV